MIRASDLSTRDVINTVDGRRLGNIVDVEIDLIRQDSRRGGSRASQVLGILGRADDYVVNRMSRKSAKTLSWLRSRALLRELDDGTVKPGLLTLANSGQDR